MKPTRTLLALALASLFAGSAAFAEGCPKAAAAKSEKSSCCTASDKASDKGCCGEKTSCCGSSTQKDPRKGQTPSGK